MNLTIIADGMLYMTNIIYLINSQNDRCLLKSLPHRKGYNNIVTHPLRPWHRRDSVIVTRQVT